MSEARVPRAVQYLITIGIGLIGLVALCWGLRVAATTGRVGPFPGVLIATVGVILLILTGYCYYAIDFKGRAGTRAFVLRITSAAVMGFFSMLLARALFK